MKSVDIPLLTICGIEELPRHGARAVTHVLSILDPERAELDAFETFTSHHRVTLRFHDDIAPLPGRVTPQPEHVAGILRFGEGLAPRNGGEGHLLVHCHMGVSRSTAAMLTLMAQANAHEDADSLFRRLVAIRPQAWPNSRMIGFADAQLGRGGALVEALRRHYGRQMVARPEFKIWMTDLGRGAELEMATPA
ncbi:MAG: protein-tyrosine-phosphatase [Rhizobiales bacterium]|nr:protein-tyrosine-phosphatase [Hyphomicrobiales bacterium]